MFTPISEKQKERLDQRGCLHLRVDPDVPFTGPDMKMVPHIIAYVNKPAGRLHSLFSCKITHTNTMCIMTHVRKQVSGIYEMDEPALHMFLEWLCFEAQNWAKDAQKERLMIETCLPHITEHFINYGYEIRQYWSRGADRGYRGLKRVMDA